MEGSEEHIEQQGGHHHEYEGNCAWRQEQGEGRDCYLPSRWEQKGKHFEEEKKCSLKLSILCRATYLLSRESV